MGTILFRSPKSDNQVARPCPCSESRDSNGNTFFRLLLGFPWLSRLQFKFKQLAVTNLLARYRENKNPWEGILAVLFLSLL